MSPHTSNPTASTADPALASASSACVFRRAINALTSSSQHPQLRIHAHLPPPSKERLEASIIETPLDGTKLAKSDIGAAEEKGKTVLYLAYGSNLCNETFREKRGIRPLSQVNVLVPSLRLTFDLPGVPYYEPCFGNSALRVAGDEEVGEDYHKDRWHKGMVGCVYEVTPTDYVHIIATEGGGASYQDILVDCYPLASDTDTVPERPTSLPFKAHTLFAPLTNETRLSRPDPSYAQPSARYLKLITDGAAELGLPMEYQVYLNEIRTYTITSTRQTMGRILLLGVWLPIIMAFFAISALLQDKNGKVPKWVGLLMGWLFMGMWMSYDGVWKNVFGDGERTEGDEEDAGKLLCLSSEEKSKSGTDQSLWRRGTDEENRPMRGW
jgi:hypothetical protein